MLALAASTPVLSEQLLSLSWDTAPALAGEVVEGPEGKAAVLVLRNDTGRPMIATVAKVEDPGVTASSYALLGEVRYDGVEGDGYLELWNLFPDGSRYFSRTLGEIGPMKKLNGSSDWREFTLPFNLMDSPLRPSSLIFNVVLPGKGEVFLGSLELVQY
jgi:hypothetical protein